MDFRDGDEDESGGVYSLFKKCQKLLCGCEWVYTVMLYNRIGINRIIGDRSARKQVYSFDGNAINKLFVTNSISITIICYKQHLTNNYLLPAHSLYFLSFD